MAKASEAIMGSSSCEANGGKCLSNSGQTASDIGHHVHDQDVVLMQLRTKTVMPKVTWSESDPILDEDFPEDDQPGGQDLTRLAPDTPNVPPNVTHVQVAQVQASLHVAEKQEPADNKDAGSKNDTATSPAAAAVDVKTDEADASSATNGGNTSEATLNASNTSDVANTSGNSTNDTANATTNVTNVSTKCATRLDDRIQSWFSSPALPGSPCIFGVDVRDENSHCIYDGGLYGSFGWCFTTSDRSEWGACNEHCPLYGAPSSLGKKIDKVSKKLDSVVAKLIPNTTDEANEDAKDKSNGEENAANSSAEKSAGSNAAADKGKSKGKGKEKGTEGKGKGKGKDKGKDRGKW